MRYPYYRLLIWVSNGHTFDFLLKPFFLEYSREKSKTVSNSAQILNEKSAFSPATVVFEKYDYYQSTGNGCLVYPEITQISEPSL